MKKTLADLLNRLLGPRCVCGQRVFPKDRAMHVYLEHAGDPYVE